MITCTFFGGLGNNLFQLATVYNLHKKYGFELRIPSSVDRGNIQIYNQSTQLELNDLFDNDFYYDDSIPFFLKTYVHSDYFLHTTDYSFKEIPIQDNCNYRGYFQSPLYFSDIDIKSEFKLNVKKIDLIKEKYQYYFNKKNISLHYRLGGDRVTSSMQHFHKNVSVEFYLNALSKLSEYNQDEYNILVFSDNIPLAEKNLSSLNYPFIFIDNKNDNIMDFIMMSLCNINIVGNSTFSWWSAFLNQNQNNKVIVTENEWFGPGYKHFNLKDTFPKEWIRIKS
jgi:hypothetical protein